MKIKYFLLGIIFSLIISCDSNSEFINSDNINNFGGVLNVSLSTPANTIVPAYLNDISSSQISSQVFEGLIKFNSKNLSIEKGIVNNWTVDKSGLVYTFTLNYNVFFHDDICFTEGKGRNVTSEDVKYTIYLLTTKNVDNKNSFITIDNIKGAKEYYEASAKGTPDFDIEGFKIIDNYSFEITLIKQGFPLIGFLASAETAIVPKEGIEMYGKNNVIGCGPFRVIKLNANEPIVLARNNRYFKTDKKGNFLPYMDTIIVSHVRSSKSQLDRLKKGDLDIVYGINNYEATEFLKDNIINFESKNPKYKAELSKIFTNDSLQNIMNTNIEGFYTNKHRYLDFSLVYYKKQSALSVR